MQLKLVTELQPGDLMQFGPSFARVETTEVFMFTHIRVYTDMGQPVYPITTKVWVKDSDPDTTLINRPSWWVCPVCSNSGLPCACRIKP